MRTLPPDPDQQNDDRAAWAKTALIAFQRHVGSDEDDAIGDLLADLMHFCDRRDEGSPSFEDELARARGHYESETMSSSPSHTLNIYRKA